MSEDFIFVAQSQATRGAVEQARQLARTDVPVLIVGPDGSGRKRLADFIHHQSPRRGAAFHPLDCDLLAEQQWYSRLFGHVAGAFAGATSERVGLFQVVAGGTLLLREIDRAPHDLHTHLQRVLEDRTFRALGREEEPIPVACRVIATVTTRDGAGEGLPAGLRSLLAGSIIQLLPLSERTDDIPDLIEYFLTVYNGQRGKQLKRPDADLMARLCRLPWDGNVQELENTIVAAVGRASDDHFAIDLFPELIQNQLQAPSDDATSSRGRLADDRFPALEQPNPLPDLELCLANLPMNSRSCEISPS